jgi:hypothetical protein
MTSIKTWLVVVSLAPVALSQVSCADIECGEGTIERDGQCVPAEGVSPDNNFCAAGTHYDANMGGCVSDFPATECQEGTTEAIVDPETGVVTCVGIGGGGGCDIPCPQPDAGKVVVCGWLRDAETDELLGGMSESGARCDVDNPTDTGPCSLQIEAYDALTFAGDPTGTPPLPTDQIIVNNCGRYVIDNAPAPALNFIGVAADDNENGTVDNVVLSGVVIPSSPGLRYDGLDAFVVTNASDTKWSGQAGLTGQTFGERGVFMPIFSHKGTPIEGVVVIENGSTQPSEDYYFSDTDPFERSMVDPAQSSTGPNGSGLLINSQLTQHSGQGSEGMLEGCQWPENLATSVAGLYFVSRRESIDSNDEVCE